MLLKQDNKGRENAEGRRKEEGEVQREEETMF